MVSSIYSSATSGMTSAAGRKGISGLASGMNTEELIDAMTLGTRTKIAKAKQGQTMVGWKTDAYRSITNLLLDFKNKYLNATSKTNMMGASFFQNATVTSQGANASMVNVSGASASALANFSVRSVSSLAQNAAFTSSVTASGRAITGDSIGEILLGGVDSSIVEGETLGIKFGETTYALKLSNVKVGETDAENAQYIADAINAQIDKNAGIKGKIAASFDGTNLKIGVTEAAAGQTMDISGVGSNMSSVLGLTTGNGQAEYSTDLTGVEFLKNQSASDALKGKSITFSLNGTSKTVSFGENPPINSASSMSSFLQDALNSAFGTGKINVTENAGKLSIETSDQTSKLLVAGGDSAALKMAGLEAGDSNRIHLSRGLANANLSAEANTIVGNIDENNASQITVNGNTFSVYSNRIEMGGKTWTFDSGTTMNNIINTINGAGVGVKIAYNEATDNFNVQATQAGASGKVDIGGDFGNALFGEAAGRVSQVGKDAMMTVSFDGGLTTVDVTRDTNNINLNGMTVSLKGTFTSGDAVTFSSQPNTDTIVSAIKDMVTAYNDIIAKVNGEVSTRHNRNYAPLTDDQRKEMSESEIKLWEEKAKTGLLFGDSILSSLASDFRFAMTMSVGSSGLKDIGINVSSNWQDNGKLTIDEDKLRAAIEADPEKVKTLFTQSSSGTVSSTDLTAGVMTRMSAVMDKYAATLGSQKGLLVEKAGHESSPLSMTNYSMLKEYKSYDTQIDNLTRKLATEELRYQKQFTSLESFISKMNEQSSWLQNAFTS